MTDHDRKLEALLRRRHFEQPSRDLALRIITATAPSAPLRQRIADWLARYTLLPHPAYAAALCMILGVLMGAQFPALFLGDSDDEPATALFDNSFGITAEDEFL